MKTSTIAIGLLAIAFACSKDDPIAAVTGGCSVTFKGTAYTLSVATCVESGTVTGVSSASTGGTIGFVISRDSSDPTSNSLTFTLDTNDMTGESTYVAADGITSQPTITVSGKTWTFSGTAENSMADSGSISGTCTCPN